MNLTINHLQRIYDSVKQVLYVHPEDLNQPLVDFCRTNGYDIISRDTMIQGKAFIQNVEKCGVVDFETGEVYLGKNTLAEWNYMPLWK